jgi:DnaK suppressor protein
VAKSSKKAATTRKARPPTRVNAARSSSPAPRAAAPSKKTSKPTSKSTSKSIAKSTSKSKSAARSSNSKTPPPPPPTLKPALAKRPAAAASITKLGSINATNQKMSDVKPTNGKSLKAAPVSTIIPPPGPPRSKPSKNQAGFSMKELEGFRDALLAKRRELVGDMRSMESEALQRSGENLSNLPLHMADMGTDNYEQEFTLGLMEKDRQLLREINQALSKIMDGRYGICEGTGKVIAKARLEVQPWAKYSIEHARKLENRGVR